MHSPNYKEFIRTILLRICVGSFANGGNFLPQNRFSLKRVPNGHDGFSLQRNVESAGETKRIAKAKRLANRRRRISFIGTT